MTTLEIPDTVPPYHERASSSTSVAETAVDSEENAEPSVPKDIPRTIPPQHDSRTLVLCFDGTGDQFDADNSNIVQLCWLLKKDDRSQQMVYYQAGVGTYTPPRIPGLITSKVYKVRTAVDLMIACSLDAHVMDGYQFLMQNYHAGDRVCIFGFSRGAYTARSLAGMIHKVGLLPPDNFQQVPFAYQMYTRTDEIGWCQSTAFKESFCVDVPIEFVGVWDTVDSVGLVPKRLPFTASNTIIRTFRHAVSLDEHRAKFKANLWNLPTTKEMQLGTPSSSRYSSRKNTVDRPQHVHGMKSGIEWRPDDERFLRKMEELHASDFAQPTDVEEVWFAGCHCDVGGGSVKNSTRYSLARIPLRWMIRECFKAQTGIMFDSDRLREIGLDPATLYPSVKPRPRALSVKSAIIQREPKKKPLFERILSTFRRLPPALPDTPDEGQTLTPETLSVSMDDEQCPPIGTEEEEELGDVLSPIYDQLKRSKLWWILELMPMEFRRQTGNGEWVSWFGINLGRPREIPNSTSGIKVHRSVRMRMEACRGHDRGKYQPKAQFTNPIWIDDDIFSETGQRE
ncbi:uncharacterized protein EV420DRAFT_1271505 [Desarmillaria tabescens]|uniref:T6SS Phospholipase effector Tle1-like catalytic domain-containing protein n=1 Tax=Armillaria tabescens TaxID=1929756 RepID=A0AA39KD06_ARMTA|nr:uncharacterized protein EV420DRAFT_1271505 [Desarmillaria tabescens]KAK0457554.1 hypothetical protein EV420DRAFT_1271505 [Desarmillaria tabescens]